MPAYLPLRLTAPSGGTVEVVTPVVLAPMAGVTNLAYRRLCAEQGAGLYVCEMITSRGIVERNPKTFDMLTFAPDESVKSVQLYGVNPAVMGRAAAIVCAEFGVQHIDLNLGCPVPKVTRKGGGGVLPWKTDRLTAILRATVEAADGYGVPVTIKTRLGIDADHETFLDTGRIAQDAGVAGIALHARSVQEAYAGQAHWERIAELVDAVDIPVLGNGDIWEASDALAMVDQTGASGVVVGRGCLGRPWLFADLARAFGGQSPLPYPKLGEVSAMLRRHAELLTDIHGERWGLTDLRKHMAWYFKGFPVGGQTRRALSTVSSFAELDALLSGLDPDAELSPDERGKPRGRQGTPRAHVTLPYGWLDSRELGDEDLFAAESNVSGG